MKSVLILICMTGVWGAFSDPAAAHAANTLPVADASGGVAPQNPATPAKRGHGKQPARPVQSNLAGLKGTVVKEMRATKAFVKENVVQPASADRGLMLLAGVGMIVLQLRRKHKSLPQRPIAPYA